MDSTHEHITDHDILLILLCHRPWSVLFNIFNVSPLIYKLNLPPCLWALAGSHSTLWGTENEKIMTLIHCKSSTWCRKKGAEVNSSNRVKWKWRVTPFSPFGRSICKLFFFFFLYIFKAFFFFFLFWALQITIALIIQQDTCRREWAPDEFCWRQ